MYDSPLEEAMKAQRGITGIARPVFTHGAWVQGGKFSGAAY